MDKHCTGFDLAFKEGSRKAPEETEPPKGADQRLSCLNTNPKIHPLKQDWFFHRLEGRARLKPNPNKQNKVFPDKIKGFFTFPLSTGKKKRAHGNEESAESGIFSRALELEMARSSQKVILDQDGA